MAYVAIIYGVGVAVCLVLSVTEPDFRKDWKWLVGASIGWPITSIAALVIGGGIVRNAIRNARRQNLKARDVLSPLPADYTFDQARVARRYLNQVMAGEPSEYMQRTINLQLKQLDDWERKKRLK